MSDHILIFSFGPVQGFISEARRAQDLWAGSTWLSDVARAALTACQQLGARLIYPTDPSQLTLPNLFVVRAASDSVKALVDAAEAAARNAVVDRALGVAQPALRALVAVDPVWEGIWTRQTENHLEIYWAAAPMGEAGYTEAYHSASRAFEATKRLRPFSQTLEEGVKDSLSGSRSALRTRDLGAREYWAALAGAIAANPHSGYSPSMLKPGGRERLDALGASKRFGFDGQRFPSLSTVAVGPFLKLAGTRCPEALMAHREKVEALGVFRLPRLADRLPGLEGIEWPFDGDLLYAETLTPERLKADYGVTPDPNKVKDARKSLQDLLDRAGSLPSRYYAILMMDGNSVGEHIWRCASEDEHRRLSDTLGQFAAAVQVVEDKFLGRVVYSGGDDLLALLPLSHAVPAACNLADQFKGLFSAWTQQHDDGTPLPFSVRAGVAIAHERYPLSVALKAAHVAEGLAREVGDKAALAVQLLIRSGVPVLARAPWADLEDRFDDAVSQFGKERMSPRFANELAGEAPHFVGLPADAFSSEVARLAKRHNKRKAQSASEARGFAETMAGWKSQANLGPEELAVWISVAGFVAREGGAV